MADIAKAKNSDYSRWEENPFRNFEYLENLTQWKCKTEYNILGLMCNKMSRIANLIDSEADVKDEKITDTLLDLANYSIILLLYIENKCTTATTETNFIKTKEI